MSTALAINKGVEEISEKDSSLESTKDNIAFGPEFRNITPHKDQMKNELLEPFDLEESGQPNIESYRLMDQDQEIQIAPDKQILSSQVPLQRAS